MFNSLTFKNLKGRPVRTFMMIIMSFLMSLVAIAGSLMITGLKSGLSSLEERLGADLMVLPYASSQSDSDTLYGNDGYYYMDRKVMDYLGYVDGIKEYSEQYMLGTLSASCCSEKIRIIAFNPDTDFTIKPWINKEYKSSLSLGEVIIGSNLSLGIGDTFTAYSYDLTIKAQMDPTGTYLDNTMYASIETVQAIIDYNTENQIYKFETNPTSYVSNVMINVKDGYTIDEVMGSIKYDLKIKYHYTDLRVVATKDMISSIAGSLNTISGIIGALVVAIWALSFVVILVSYIMMINERKKEFAIIRVVGGSKKKLHKLVFKEVLVVCITGGVLGTALGSLIMILFKTAIFTSTDLPFLFPVWWLIIILIFASILFSGIAGSIASLIATAKINKIDPAITLREDN